MNLLNSLFGRFITEKAVSNPPSGSWTTLTGGPSAINERTLLEANKEWVYAAANKNAIATAAVRFKVMRYKRNGDEQEIFDGPLVSFLESPAPNFSGKDFIYLNTIYKELTGNAFWELLGNGKIRPLIPTQMRPIVRDGELLGFKYTEGASDRTILAKYVLHDRSIDPAKPHWGIGKLQKVARWVDTSFLAGEILSKFFENGATFGGFIETEEETEARIKLIKLGLQNDHVGVANAHKLAVLPKGSKYAPTTANMADMEMGATDDRYRDKILAGFGVPKTVLGLTTEVNRASAEASEYIYAKYTIKPIVEDFIDFLNMSVAPLFDKTGATYFAYDEFVPENMEIKLREREIALAKQPYMTVNEVRASVSLPPVQGGDVVYGSPMQVPIGTPPITQITPAAPANDNEEPKKAMPARARAAMKQDRALEKIAERALTVITAHHDPDEASHKSFVSRVEGHEGNLAGKMRDFNNRQEREVTQRLTRITKAVKNGDVFEYESEVGVLVDFVTPILKLLMLEQLAAEFADQGFPGAPDQSSPGIAQIVDRAAKRVAKSYNATTASLLSSALNAGISQGEDLTQLAARVRSVYEYSDVVRAKQVANTEAFYIANEGSREAYRQSGVVQSLRWYTAVDERVCEFCGPEDGRVVGIDENFYSKGEQLVGSDGTVMALDYRSIDVPPLHPNCRCFIRPEAMSIT